MDERRSIRILLVEDNPDDAELTIRALKTGGFDPQVTRVQTPETLREALARTAWDIVLSDYSLPKMTAMTAIPLIRAVDPDVPIIVVSGTVGEDTAVATLKAGAQDYILKDRTVRLPSAVNRELADAANRRTRRQMEADLRRSEEQLRQAQKMEAIGRLAGGVAHDFNNILAAIFLYCETAMEKLPEDHPARSEVTEILRSSKRAAEIIEQLMAFSRKKPIEVKVLDMNPIVQDSRDMLARLTGEKILLKTEIENGLAPVKADRTQLEQILLNLIVNARDAMPEGGRILIRTSTQTVQAPIPSSDGQVPPGTYSTIHVIDHGKGMDHETQAKIFEPFFTTKDPGKGTGMGLATVYGIVKSFGGHIVVESEVGKGTTFTIYLPQAEKAGFVAEPAPNVELTTFKRK